MTYWLLLIIGLWIGLVVLMVLGMCADAKRGDEPPKWRDR